jgi:hypothetical protein
MSKLKNLTEKNMRFLLRRMYNNIVDYGRPRELVSGANQKIVKDILDDIGMTVETEDLSFIFSLYRMNPNYETESIKVPKLHTYEIITRRYARISVKEMWKNTVDSYLEDEDDVQEFEEWFSNSDWWEGEMIDRDEYDEETTDTDIDEINKLS